MCAVVLANCSHRRTKTGRLREQFAEADDGWAIDFLRVPDGPKRTKNRIHHDVDATDRDQAAELERLLAIGARPVDIGQGDVSWRVLADPEGNEFCLLRQRVEPDPS